MPVDAKLIPDPTRSLGFIDGRLAHDPPEAHETPRFRRLRVTVGYAVIAGTIPYLTLKVAWLSGSTVGIDEPDFAADSSLTVLNAVTAGMDFVAILVALALTHRFGQRLPSSLLLVPVWVGTGLLVPIAAALPVTAVGGWLSGAAASVAADPLEPWVRPVVYGGFAWQAALLSVAFVLYARTRWPQAFSGGESAQHTGVARAVTPLARGGAGLAALAAAGHIQWAIGGSFGLSADAIAVRSLQGDLVHGVHGLLALAAAVGIVMLVGPARRRKPYWLPVAMTWVGAGSMFAWGLWQVVNVLGGTALAGGTSGMAVANFHSLVKVIAGLLIGVTALIVLTLTPRTAVAGSASPTRGDGA